MFFGGDAFALPRSFTALLDEIGEACARRGARFEGTVLSDGTAWSAEAVREFSCRGVRRYQVALDGPASIHDQRRPLRCSGGSFAKIMASLKFQREDADVLVRVNAAIGVSAIEALVQDMKGAGLLADPNPITVYVAPPTSYRDQAQSLLDLFTWRETQPSSAPGPAAGSPADDVPSTATMTTCGSWRHPLVRPRAGNVRAHPRRPIVRSHHLPRLGVSPRLVRATGEQVFRGDNVSHAQ